MDSHVGNSSIGWQPLCMIGSLWKHFSLAFFYILCLTLCESNVTPIEGVEVSIYTLSLPWGSVSCSYIMTHWEHVSAQVVHALLSVPRGLLAQQHNWGCMLLHCLWFWTLHRYILFTSDAIILTYVPTLTVVTDTSSVLTVLKLESTTQHSVRKVSDTIQWNEF